jgi:hypothetical protein
MKKISILLILILVMAFSGCEEDPEVSKCLDDPLGEGCYVPPEDLQFQSPIKPEYVIDENFEGEPLNQMPSNWLLYKNEEYLPNGVQAFVVQEGGNNYVKMFSDGKQKPMYPQGASTPTFIFTTKFNLDQARKGIAYGSVLIPGPEKLPENGQHNGVTIGLATGAVNTASVTIGKDLKIYVKIGGPFFYHSGNNDSGDIHVTNITVEKNQWYRFRFEWDAALNKIKIDLLNGENTVNIYDGAFHISSRYNALANGKIQVPNVFKVTMDYNSSGWAFLDNVKVERKVD